MTANRIKQAALTQFAESGYDGVALSDIAKAVGIKTPSLYAHFASKEALFLAVFDGATQADDERLAALIANSGQGGYLDVMEDIFHYYTEYKAQHEEQAFLRRTMLMPPRKLKEQLQQSFERYETEVTERLAGVLERGMAAGELAKQDTKPILVLFYAIVDGLLVEQQLYAEDVYRSRQRQLWDTCARYIKRG